MTTPSSGETTHRYPGLVLATLAIANVMALWESRRLLALISCRANPSDLQPSTVNDSDPK